jgi:protocatechuate 3,4-dioxygenase beta subunit
MLTTITVILAIVATAIHAQQACQLTDPDILGPYYIPGAPKAEEQLCANLPAHDRLILTGQVVDYDSKCAKGIPYATLDLWQVINEEKYHLFCKLSLKLIGQLQWCLFRW